MLEQQPDYSKLLAELEYGAHCSELEARCSVLEEENKQMKEELQVLKSTVSAVVARSIGACGADDHKGDVQAAGTEFL